MRSVIAALAAVLTLAGCAGDGGVLDPADDGQVDPLPRFASVTSSGVHSCALSVDGRAYCWGPNNWGQLGTETAERCTMGEVGPDNVGTGGYVDAPCGTKPVAVSGGHLFATLATHNQYTCGLTRVGEAFCWGHNWWGQLGDGTQVQRNRPQRVAGGHRFRTLTLGQAVTCGLTLSDELLCWGTGPHPDFKSNVPVRVAAEHRFRLAATSPGHTCGVTLDSTTLCWGLGNVQLGLDQLSTTCDVRGRPLPCTNVPQRVSDEISFTALAASVDFNCGLGNGGRAYCWGVNGSGQLGDGGLDSRARPLPVVGERTFSSITTGRSFACALDAEGAAFCWGRDDGTFGLGRNWGGFITEPVAAAPGLRLVSLSAGHHHACGLDRDGFVYCWGANVWGEVGTGGKLESVLRPVRVAGQG
jgi:alpha-tubulin suppressor-like RCC1 family protein